MLKKSTNYSHLAMPNTFGVNMITYGLDSCFKPWYSDGKVVYWGQHCFTRSEAEAAAKAMASGEWESSVL